MDVDFMRRQEYALNRIFLWAIGICPYQTNTLFKRIFVLTVIVTIIIPQIIKAIMEWHRDLDVAIQVVPTCIATSTSLTKYLNAIINEAKMMKLLSHMKKDYDEMMKLPQKVLMKSGSMQGRKITIFYSLFIFTFASLFSLIPVAPIFLDIVIPLNESRQKKFLFEMECFIDSEKYYYHIMLYEYVSTILVINILVAVDTMFMVYIQHACTLFMILSNQLKYLHIMEDEYMDEQKVKKVEKYYMDKIYTKTEYHKMYQKLRWGIKLHNNTLSYTHLVQSSFTTALAVQVLFNVICISFTGIQLVINLDNTDDVTRYGSFITGQLVHLFFLCFSGQRLLDYSSQMNNDACSSMWYLFPKNTQSVYKFLLMRSSHPCRITAGKFATMDMETFLSVTRTAMSYFTVLSSVH